MKPQGALLLVAVAIVTEQLRDTPYRHEHTHTPTPGEQSGPHSKVAVQAAGSTSAAYDPAGLQWLHYSPPTWRVLSASRMGATVLDPLSELVS